MPAISAVRSTAPANAKVQLDIFSGRPNPEWTLTGGEARDLAERLTALPPAAARHLFTNLGYRGLIVIIRQPTGKVTARIQNGIVEITRGARATYHEDRNRALEHWLIRTGKVPKSRDPVR